VSQPAKSRAAALPIVAGTIGNVIEWYDFAVYAYFAPTIGALFFPSDVPNRSPLLGFGVFGVGFFMRPSAASSSATTATGAAAGTRSPPPSS